MSHDDISPSDAGAAAVEPPRKRRRRRRFAIWAVVLLVFALVVWGAMRAGEKRKAPAAAPPPVTVTTTTVTRGDLPIYIDAIGTVTPIYTASITSQATGSVVAVHYQEGQLVHKGTPLVDIDPRPLAAQLMQAEGTLERDQHVLEQARMDLERYRAAWSKHAIARQQLDDQEKLVLQAEGTVKLDQGLVEYDRVQLGYAHIVSPIDGRVGLRLVDPGNVVTANGTTVLAVITQEQPISVVFAISEDNLSRVLAQPDRGAKLPVELYDRIKANKLATGELITIDNQIDTTTGTVRLRARFDNGKGELFPNQFVNAKLLVTTLRGTAIVPSSAIQHDGQKAFVYAIEGGVAHMREVKPGPVTGEMTQVSGVDVGTVVANSSFEKLHDGAKITEPASGSGSATK